MREPTFPFEMRAVLVVFHHFFGQTLPRLNRRKQQFTFLIIAQNHLQHLDGEKGRNQREAENRMGRYKNT